MIMNNEDKNLSRNRKRRIEQKIKKDDKLELFLNETKTEKKNKSNDKFKQLEIELVELKYADKPDKL